MNTDTAQKPKRKREKPLIGPKVAKLLLEALREMRQHEAQGLYSMRFRMTEEIEAWEDLIRESVKGWRKAPREVLKLDSETTVALDDALSPRRRLPETDSSREWRRRFALRAIRAVCQAWVDMPNDRITLDFAVTLREMTDDEKRVELLSMQAGLEEG